MTEINECNIDDDGNILAMSYEQYKKPFEEVQRGIIKTLLKRVIK